jgi:hypothetical protein
MTPEQARATSDLIHDRPAMQGVEVTELPPAEAAIQWRLAVALLSDPPDFQNTVPAWEA